MIVVTIWPSALRWVGYSAVVVGLFFVMAGYRATSIIALIAVGALLPFTARMLERVGRRGGWRWESWK